MLAAVNAESLLFLGLRMRPQSEVGIKNVCRSLPMAVRLPLPDFEEFASVCLWFALRTFHRQPINPGQIRKVVRARDLGFDGLREDAEASGTHIGLKNSANTLNATRGRCILSRAESS